MCFASPSTPIRPPSPLDPPPFPVLLIYTLTRLHPSSLSYAPNIPLHLQTSLPTLLYASIIKHLCPLIVPRTTIQHHFLKGSLEFLLGTYISIYVYPPIYIYRLFLQFIYNNSLFFLTPSHPPPPLSQSISLSSPFARALFLSFYLSGLSNVSI